ncbi:MAG: thioredoxin-disulfide reductase [Pseudomonadota bacterium]
MVHKVIILGSGPAGLTASIYCGRARLEPICIAGSMPGGQLMFTTKVENFPGYPDGIMGQDLMENMEKHATNFGTKFIKKNATKLDLSKRPYKVFVSDEEYETDSIIIATGAFSKMLGLPNEKDLIGKGLSTCAVCDGFFFRGKDVAIVGGGDSALEEALFLSRFANKVTIIHRRDAFRASKAMQERIKRDSKIEVLWNSTISGYLGDEYLEGLKIKNVKTSEEKDHNFDGVFLAIGHIPNTDVFKDSLETDDEGYIKVNNVTKTNVLGVFVAGDVKDRHYKQAITAAGSGCQAALDCERWLEEECLC